MLVTPAMAVTRASKMQQSKSRMAEMVAAVAMLMLMNSMMVISSTTHLI